MRDKPAAPAIPESFVTLKSTQKTAKWAYWKLKEQEKAPGREKCHDKWQADFNRIASLTPQIQWSALYDQLHHSAKDVNLRWLQYRIVKRILPTNRLLYIMGLSETDKCKTCLIYSENIMHKFWMCPSVRLLWLGVEQLLGLSNHLTHINILLGLKFHDEGRTCSANTVIMLTNQFIWKHKDNPEMLRFKNLKHYIHQYLTIEIYISKITGTEGKFGERWGRIWEYLSRDRSIP